MTSQIVRGHPSTMGDDYPLNTTTIIRHAARTHGDQDIVYRQPGGGWDRYTYANCYQRVRRAANALRSLGVEPGDRVGVLDWNSRRHFELYWAIPGLAAVMLQMNLRLAAEDLAYVVEHSGASFIAVDESLLPVAESLAPRVTGVKGWIVLTDTPLDQIDTSLAPVHHYEDLLATAAPEIDWPVIDERSAYSACYTTGTTGRPKGVYYSHRAIYLHALAEAATLGMTLDDTTMLITPMFHAQCWGLPQSVALTGGKLVLPGRYTADDTGPLITAMIDEQVTIANGAPVIFQPMLDYLRAHDLHPDFRRTRLLAGSAEPPLSLMRGFHDTTGADILHGYGATETTPLIAVNRWKPALHHHLNTDELWDLRRKQGLPLTGVDIVLRDAHGQDLPHDGTSVGEVCVRGPWITAAYHELPDSGDRFTADGYWRSGDAGTIDEHGYLKLTDRMKDVIKSGGEWISSIDMENALAAHPAVAEAAVVGVPHPKWQERALALVVVAPGGKLTEDDVRDHLASRFASWQLPESVLFVDEIARTSVGKIDKKRLRSRYHDLYATATGRTDD
ncbi:long-chain-fatty-acid--CoA ligase [Nocardia wallacei]|uniref:long-chain-fatty-acid--CoA ligase n=1 Tax=Nocardia wallacei TaxID=480035 RepID=UPI002457591E|nr:long-chain-fatty-acid--CoA ligase [Nocardia wallacei]